MSYYVALGGLLARRVVKASGACFALSAALLLIGPRLSSRDAVPPPSMPLRVAVLDVGQGDATVIALPGGRTMLVDSGGLTPLSTGPDGEEAPAFDVGERVVAPALRALGVRRIDSMVITHGDPDHLGGATGVLRHFAARHIWEGVPVPPHAGLNALAGWASERGVTWRRLQAGDAERYGDVEVRVLHPPLPDWERQRVRNEDSIVLELRLGSVSIVLPGDIGREGEQALLPRLERGRIVVLKAPHHGSATSSTAELLEVLQPVAVIFSAGRNNRFGHPHPAVVERYRAIGSRIFSTAEDGAVFVETDGKRVEVRGHQSGRRDVFVGQSQSSFERQPQICPGDSRRPAETGRRQWFVSRDSRSRLRRAHGALRARRDGATTRRCDEILVRWGLTGPRGKEDDSNSVEMGGGQPLSRVERYSQSGQTADGALRARATRRRGDEMLCASGLGGA